MGTDSRLRSITRCRICGRWFPHTSHQDECYICNPSEEGLEPVRSELILHKDYIKNRLCNPSEEGLEPVRSELILHKDYIKNNRQKQLTRWDRIRAYWWKFTRREDGDGEII